MPKVLALSISLGDQQRATPKVLCAGEDRRRVGEASAADEASECC